MTEEKMSTQTERRDARRVMMSDIDAMEYQIVSLKTQIRDMRDKRNLALEVESGLLIIERDMMDCDGAEGDALFTMHVKLHGTAYRAD